jgi:hypothetical protein
LTRVIKSTVYKALSHSVSLDDYDAVNTEYRLDELCKPFSMCAAQIMRDVANGFGNRFLWACARRSKFLPDGGQPDPSLMMCLREPFQSAINQARAPGELRRDAAAQECWHQVYRNLSEGRPGLLGSMTGRAEAQVMRLACLYALGDRATEIGLPHLEAALAVWRYCFDSARFIFGESLGNPVADDLLAALRLAGVCGLSRSEMTRELFGRNRSAREINQALAVLHQHGLARGEVDRSGAGRPVERWFAVCMTT